MNEPEVEATYELLAHASRLLASTWNEQLAELGITQAGYIALSAAAASPSSHQAALAATLHVKTPTIGGILDRLEHQGHVVTHRLATDTRYRIVRLTPKGRSVLQRGREIEQSLLSGAEELRTNLLQLLSRILQQPGLA